jgi:hypothetical protein
MSLTEEASVDPHDYGASRFCRIVLRCLAELCKPPGSVNLRADALQSFADVELGHGLAEGNR